MAVENRRQGREFEALRCVRELRELRERADRLRKYREESSMPWLLSSGCEASSALTCLLVAITAIQLWQTLRHSQRP